uniref:PH domain-containing protein n=1 Tax=Panagrolaimus sp. ES5 TaxID=591445 RepID=A0AC34FFA9_9BILA
MIKVTKKRKARRKCSPEKLRDEGGSGLEQSSGNDNNDADSENQNYKNEPQNAAPHDPKTQTSNGKGQKCFGTDKTKSGAGGGGGALVSVNELQRITEKNAAQVDVAVIQKVYKGWMNILYEPYNVHASCYKDIQPVLIQLEGPFLRISRPERLVMKHSTQDDPTFTKDFPPMLSESTYDITNAKIKLRPKHLARRRWWVRRYPICIVLASPDDKMHSGGITDDGVNVATIPERASVSPTTYDSDSDHELESDGEQVERKASASTDQLAKSNLQKNFRGPNPRTTRRTIHLFARTPREKERWFHVLRKVCNKYSTFPHESDALEMEKKMFLPEGWTLPKNMNKHYFLYVLQQYRYAKHLDKVLPSSVDNRTKCRETIMKNGGIVNMDLGRVGWHPAAHYSGDDDLVVIANMFGSRILFDYYHNISWIKLLQGRIQAKIAAIHLPYFIDTLELKDFDMGNVIPEITKIYKPVVDDCKFF